MIGTNNNQTLIGRARLVLLFVLITVNAVHAESPFVEYVPVSIAIQARAADIVVLATVLSVEPINSNIGAASVQCGWKIVSRVIESYRGGVTGELVFAAERDIVVYRHIKSGDQLLLFLERNRPNWLRKLRSIVGFDTSSKVPCENQSVAASLSDEYEGAFLVSEIDAAPPRKEMLYWAARTRIDKSDSQEAGENNDKACGRLACPIEPSSVPWSEIVPILRQLL